MQQYIYKGPVMAFDRCVSNFWEASTFAASPKKALCNLQYRYKKETNRTPNTKITLDPNHLSIA